MRNKHTATFSPIVTPTILAIIDTFVVQKERSHRLGCKNYNIIVPVDKRHV